MQRGKICFFALLWIFCSQIELSESKAQQSAIRLSHTEAAIEAYQHLEELFAAKHFPAARELAQASLHSQPNSPNREQMLAILAESCFQIGDYQAAITAFQQLLSGAGLSLHEQAQLRLGEAQFRHHNLSEAIISFEQFRQFYPKSKQLDQCLFWLGECYSQQSDKERAIAAFTQLLKNYPQSAWIEQALYSIGRLYEQSGESDKAFQVYQKLLTDFPQRELARDLIFYLGFASYQAKQYKPAIQFLQQALELYPNHPRAAESQYLIAEANFFTGENEKAVENYQKVIKNYGSSPWLDRSYYGIGWCFMQQEDWPRAVVAFDFLITNQPQSQLIAKSLLHLGNCYRRLHDLTHAHESFLTLIEQSPGNSLAAEARYYLGLLAFQQQHLEEAQEIFISLQNDSTHHAIQSQAIYMLGEIALAQNNFATAQSRYQQIIANFTDTPVAAKAIFRAGWCLMATAQPNPAAAKFDFFLQQYPDHPLTEQALFCLAESQFKIQEYQAAEEHYRQYLRQFPQSGHAAECYYGLGWMDLQQSRFADAVTSFDSAFSQTLAQTLRGEILRRKGDALFNLKLYQRAIQSYQQSLTILPTNNQAETLFQIGLCFYQSAEFSAAVRQFEELRQLLPQSDRPAAAQWLIGKSYFLAGQYDSARSAFQNLLTDLPSDDKADAVLYAIGDCDYNLGNYGDAIRSYEKLIRDYPHSSFLADAVSGLQWSMIESGKMESALKLTDHYAEMIEDSATIIQLHKRKTELLVQLSQYDAAIQIYRNLIRDYSDYDEARNAWFWIAEIYQKAGNNEMATEALMHQLAQFPLARTSANALALLADHSYQALDDDQAIQFNRQLIERFPQSPFAPAAAYHIGLSYLRLDQIVRAERYFHNLADQKRANPYCDYARLGLARIALALKTYHNAVGYLEVVLRFHNDDLAAEAQFLKGEIFFNQEKYAEAVKQYLLVRDKFAHYPYWLVRSLYSAALCYERLEQKPAATELFQIVLTNYPNTDFAKLAKQHIKQIAGHS